MEVAHETPVEEMGSDLERAVGYFAEVVLNARDEVEGGDPYLQEPATLGLAWAVMEDDAPDRAEGLRYEFFSHMTELYLDDMRLVGETGYFAIPDMVARKLGYDEYAHWNDVAGAGDTSFEEGWDLMRYAQKLLRQDRPDVDARLVFWGIEDETLTPEAAEILQSLRVERGVR